MSILEIAYYLSGPALVIIVAIGLWQLKIAKDTAKIAAKREALTIAADRCEYFLRTIMPLVDDFDNALEKENVTFFDNAKIEIEGNEITIDASCSEADFDKLQNMTDKGLSVYNSLEAFASFFTSGVADESIVFDSIGHSYCETVKQYLPDILPLCENGKNYRNLLSLFFLWNERYERMELLTQKESVESKLKRIKKKFIVPVGTR